jgi:hypothetical protein
MTRAEEIARVPVKSGQEVGITSYYWSIKYSV